MCGIVGYIGGSKASSILLDGLSKLEYRGYDSAGLCLLENGVIEITRSVGKLGNLKEAVKDRDFGSKIGLGHTRWATHGKPSFENAHPHKSNSISLVHNGIIENYLALKEKLAAEGFSFTSETDTEVIAHLVEYNYKGDLLQAVLQTVRELKGSYSLGIISEKEPDKVILARKDSPLVLGVGSGEMFAASDVPAVLSHTRNFIFLEDGDVAVITAEGYRIFDETGTPVDREVKRIDWNPVMAEKAGYRHFMQKEINEQPRALIDTIRGRYSLEDGDVFFDLSEDMKEALKGIERVVIVACGTSWHAGLVGKFYIEKFAGIPVEVDIASEYRYRDLIADEKLLFIAISQSGETADTLSALRLVKKKGAKVLSICNAVGSSIARESNSVIYTHAGPEIGVASTKAFTTQVACLFLFALYLGRERGKMDAESCRSLLKELVSVPEKLESVLKLDEAIEELAKKYKDSKDFLYLGRNVNYPIALEGALKLKEISYIHAEGYPAGEMKHGPIALIDSELPVFVIAVKGSVYEKVASNIEEVKARDGQVIAVITEGDTELKEKSDEVIELPEISEELSVFLTVTATQIFAYHCARLLGLDVDQPRNLAKSVTVE
jgi:glucosamine--fructose-6-phosphate aminotransferase (isomerizing)